MTRQPLRLTQPGELPAPLLDELSASVVTEAAGTPSPRCAPLTGPATARSPCTPWPASSPRPSR
jgi:hypothetical protein